jgi:hypothetical protein
MFPHVSKKQLHLSNAVVLEAVLDEAILKFQISSAGRPCHDPKILISGAWCGSSNQKNPLHYIDYGWL